MQATEARGRAQVERSLRVLRAFQGQLHKLAETATDEVAFLQEGLKLLMSTIGASSAAVWQRDDRGHWRPVTGSNRRLIAASHLRKYQAILQRVAAAGRAQLILPDQGTGNQQTGSPISGDAALMFREPLLIAPVRCAAAVAYLVGAVAKPGLPAASYRTHRMFLASLAQMAGEVAQQVMLRDASRGFEHFRQFIARLYGQLDLQQTAYVLANEGRRLLGCQRLSLIVRYGDTWRVEAISGQASFDRRSDGVRALEELPATLGPLKAPYWYTHAAQATEQVLPPAEPAARMKALVQAYCQRTGSKAVVIAPLVIPPEGSDEPQRSSSNGNQGEATANGTASAPVDEQLIGVVVGEQFSSNRFSADTDQRLEVVRLYGAPAVKNAVEHDTAARLSLSRWWGPRRGGPRWRRWAVAAGISLGALFPLVVIPADFALEGQAIMQPEIRRDVFALSSGVVQEVLVDHGQAVTAGQVLARVRNVDLEVEYQRLQGSASAAAERLAAVRNSLLESQQVPEADRARLAGEEAQLKQRLESLKLQIELIRVRMKDMEIRSPIDGKVITWDVRNLLTNRPVQPGHLLLTVARTDSEWELLVQMPENRMGHVLAAHRESAEPMPVTFMLTSEPGRSYEGKLIDVHGRAEQDPERGSFVPLKVRFDKAQVSQLRPGAEATAKVHCGRRSLGFVWFHDVWEFLQTQVFF